MSELTIALVGTKRIVFNGGTDAAKAYFDKLGIAPTDLLPADAALDMSDLLVKAMACVREHGNNLEAFYQSLPLAELMECHSEADLYELFQFAVTLYEAHQAAASPSDEEVYEKNTV